MDVELFSKIRNAIVQLDDQNLAKLTEEAIAAKMDPAEIIQKAYTEGLQEVGKLFEKGDFFLPEMVAAADLVQEAIGKVQKLIPEDKGTSKGKIILGTVEGDIHDIGKNLIKIWVSTMGIEVVDIGVDCPADKFINRAIEENANIIGASCLLTMTAPGQKKLIDRMDQRGVRNRFKVIVGGAAVTPAWAKEIGADAFANNMVEAGEVILTLLNKRTKVSTR
jgi:trimethylamine corrinoid protein